MEVRRELCATPGRQSAESRRCTRLVVQSRVDAGLNLKGTREDITRRREAAQFAHILGPVILQVNF